MKHEFTFTPSFSFFTTINSEDDFEKIYTELAKESLILMPVDNYGFSKKFVWLQDRFGISWQISLED